CHRPPERRQRHADGQLREGLDREARYRRLERGAGQQMRPRQRGADSQGSADRRPDGGECCCYRRHYSIRNAVSTWGPMASTMLIPSNVRTNACPEPCTTPSDGPFSERTTITSPITV